MRGRVRDEGLDPLGFSAKNTALMEKSRLPDAGSKLDRMLDAQARHRAEREKTYREQALKLFPWICARCGREFSGERLRELTVHHKDHDHDNNPPDGSNWELLCLYCHDAEHQRFLAPTAAADPSAEAHATHSPFANLKEMLGAGSSSKKKQTDD